MVLIVTKTIPPFSSMVISSQVREGRFFDKRYQICHGESLSGYFYKIEMPMKRYKLPLPSNKKGNSEKQKQTIKALLAKKTKSILTTCH
mmetsp:Transcript_23026/g.35611  ORF Transcript_23026/g.35611 Transcript_23026/m.35611 type:complete len:89 (+) Transcript_23026:230-496(+)